MHDTRAVIGNNIKILRTARGLNQYQLADELGISQSFIGNIEAGVRSPSWKLARRMAAYFGVTLDYLATPRELELT